MNSEQRKEYNRNWYRENKESNRDSHRKWMKEHPEVSRRSSLLWARKIRQEALIVLGGVCVQCGCTDMRCLEIDHVIPIKTGRRIDRHAWHRSITRGNTENLQVLCACCHSIKTYEERAIDV
jgi:5-methylcytosine-specific restriction endonuclease McrA